MSFAVPDQPAPTEPPPKQRPTVVTVANALLFVVAALYVIDFVFLLTNVGAYSDAYETAYEGTELAGTEGGSVAFTVGVGVLFLLIGAGFATLGYFNNRGKNPSRIVTWVVGGLALCCTGGTLLASGLASGLDTGSGPSQDEIADAISAELPGWYEAFSLLSSIVGLLAVIAAMVLLMLPAANTFFRKPPEVFEPPPEYPPPPAPPTAQG